MKRLDFEALAQAHHHQNANGLVFSYNPHYLRELEDYCFAFGLPLAWLTEFLLLRELGQGLTNAKLKAYWFDFLLKKVTDSERYHEENLDEW